MKVVVTIGVPIGFILSFLVCLAMPNTSWHFALFCASCGAVGAVTLMTLAYYIAGQTPRW